MRAGLQPADDVLDVGCGAGRMARPLAGWLEGTYEGFDVVEAPLRWCRRKISTRHPNFTFTHLDVANDVYNPNGRIAAAELRFPYPDDRFSFAVLTSVFTHMLATDLLQYLDELARVVRPGGRILATYFLLDRDSESSLAEGRSMIAFPARQTDGPLAPYRLTDDARPASAIAYPRSAIESAHAARGLAIKEVWPGRWARPAPAPAPAFQDATVSVAE